MANPILRGLRCLALLAVVLLAGSGRAEAGATDCGGLNERACTVLDLFHSGFVGCQTGLAEIKGTCIQLDGDGYPPYCGGLNERPCRLDEHIPSCKAGLVEHFPTDRCIQFDSDGFPAFCGGQGERACSIVEHIPSCKSGLDEVGGTCIRRDADGYPPDCGREGQPGCTLDLQARFFITSCKPDLIEIPNVGGTCVKPDADGFPTHCGDEFERGCTLLEHLPSCKPGLLESVEPSPDGGFISVCKGPPPFCGRNGQRPCLVTEHIPSCQPGLSELPFEMNVCGKAPRDWGETSANEVPRGGRRTVFFIHEGSGDLDPGVEPAFFDALRRGAPNAALIYGVDWNNAGDPPRRLRTIRYDDACQFNQSCLAEWGPEPFDYRTFTIAGVAYALGQAVRALPVDGHITIIGHGIGGIIARQLVYRHYDELRIAGRRIAEVITIGSPHGGIFAGDVNIGARSGHEIQTDTACLKEPFSDRDADRTLCQVGKWVAWMEDRPVGGVAWPSPAFGDDVDFPQVRWIAVAGNGRKLQVGPILDAARASGERGADLAAFLADVQTMDPFPDSDGAVTVGSALNLRVDECYPFSRELNPYFDPAFRMTERPYEFTLAGVPTVQLATSMHCTHANARVDPRVVELGGGDPTASPRELDFVGHTELLQNPRVLNFIIAALNLYGDTNGDGLVDGADMRADAGPDQTIPCGGATTAVQLDGSGTVPDEQGMTFTWSGPFGSVSGVAPIVSLPPGRHFVTLTVERDGYEATDLMSVTIFDATPPTLTVQPGHTVEAASATLTPFSVPVEATDACSAVIVQRTPDLAAYPFGATDVVVSATDASGNTATATVTVTVVDTTPPALVVPADVTAIASGPATTTDIGTASASDIFGAAVSHDAPASFSIGTTQVTWRAVDGNGNAATAVQRIHVVYDFAGFEGPIQPAGTYRAQRTLPLQFQLRFAGGMAAVDAIATLTVERVGGDSGAVTALDVHEESAADEGRRFRYTGNHYQYNLDTRGWEPGSYRLSVSLDDGRTHVMDMTLR